MPKKIVLKNLNGTTLNPSNVVGGHIVNPVNTTTANDCLAITEADLTLIYLNYIQPYLNEGPFYMGSNEILTAIYSRILVLIEITTNNKDKLAYEILRDILTILLQTRDVYFDKLMLGNEVATLKNKYAISEQKIMELTLELMDCKAAHEGGIRNAVLQGELGIKLHKPKNLIYAQAVFNINLAWYYFLHMQKFINPRLYMATVEYVKTMGTRVEAYDKLIGLLDEKFKTIDDVIDAANAAALVAV
jgi:hypothetical protein